MRKLLIVPILCLIAYAAYAVTVPFTIQVGAVGDFTFALPTGDVLFFIAPSGHDTCDGKGPSTGTVNPCAWATPNHSVNCGDVILAQSGTYNSSSFGITGAGTNGVTGPWGTVSNCPSTTGGIDGTGGIYFAVVLCAGADLEACLISSTVGDNNVLITGTSNWAMEGFKNTASNGGFAFGFCPCLNTTQRAHHVAFINNISYNSDLGFWTGDDGNSDGVVPGNGPDYVSFLGNIAQNSAQLAQGGGFICSAAMVVVGASQTDTVAGTHFYFYSNFSYNNIVTCTSDVENMMFDTIENHGAPNQFVAQNNILVKSSRFSFQLFYQDKASAAGQKIYILNNTSYAGGQGTLVNGANYGDLNIQNNQNAGAHQPASVKVQNNIFKTNTAGNSGGVVYAGMNAGGGGVGVTTFGATGTENIFNGTSAQHTIAFNGNNTGTNFNTDPAFTSVSDLLTNRMGVPNCTGFDNTTACMGWNARTTTLTTPSLISDLQAGCGSNCTGKGYQLPSMTCQNVQAPDGTTMYPTWLKGIVYLHSSGFTIGATITERAGLVTKPCNM